MQSLNFSVPCSLSAYTEFGEIYIRPSSQTYQDASRFFRFIQIVKSMHIETPGLVAAQLIALDGVRPQQISLLSSGVSTVWQSKQFAFLEWEDVEHSRTERRTLKDITQATIVHHQKTRQDQINSSEKLKNELIDLLGGIEGYGTLSGTERLDRLEADALAWWYLTQSMALFGHISGLQGLSAVPISALVRQMTQKVVAMTADEQSELSLASCSSGRVYSLLDDMIRSEGEDKPPTLSDFLKQLSLKSTDTNPRAKRRWLDAIETSQEKFVRAGPLTCMVVGWLSDMLEEGTIELSSPAASTVKKYFSAAAELLLEGLRQLPTNMNEWQLEALEAMYLEILQGVAKSSQRNMAAALTNFHFFLYKHHDFSWLHTPLHPKFKARVRANVIWTHEVSLALTWLETAPDLRLAEAAALALKLGSTEPIRWREFSRLRVQNVLFDDDFMSIEITPSRKIGRLKSKSSQRTLMIQDPALIECFRTWITQRRNEGATGQSLLFGDPRNEKLIYRQHALHSLVNSVLKAATGDEKCTFHTLRHSVVSAEAEIILLHGGNSGIDRLRQLSVRTGHSQTGMTVTNYAHLYELAIRRGLDQALENCRVSKSPLKDGEFTAVDAPNSAGSGIRLGGVLGLIMRPTDSRESPPQFQLLTAKFPVQDAVPPAFNAWRGSTPCVELTWWLLTRLHLGWSMEKVAHLYGLNPASLQQLLEIAIELTDEVARCSFPRKSARLVRHSSDIGTALGAASINLIRAEQPKYHSISEWFKQPRDESLILQACDAWLSCRKAEYLSLDESTAITPLFKLLRLAGVQPSLFRLCVPPASDNDTKESIAWAETDFVTGFSVSPRMVTVTPRMGRPRCYLQIDHSAIGNAEKSAGGSTEGLDAWLLAAWIHIKWSKKLSDGTK